MEHISDVISVVGYLFLNYEQSFTHAMQLHLKQKIV